MTGIKLWHGSQRWDGWPEIRASKKGQYEGGPGIYCTTSLQTARRHSKGGGSIIEFTLSPDTTWLEDIKIPHEEAVAWVKQAKHLHKKRVLANDVIAVFDRREQVRTSGMMPLTYLVNLAVNHECLSGLAAPEMAEFLVSKGAQASLCRETSNDDWVVIFDPKALISFVPKKSSDIDWTQDRVDSVKQQIAALTTSSGPKV
jgi:hypothetical protein